MLAEYPAMSGTLLWGWTILAWAAVAGLVAAAVSRRFARELFESQLRPSARALTLTVAWTTMLGSLALSELHGFLPCSLCWVQRALLYPQVVLVAVATGRSRPRWARWTVWVMTAASGATAVYQVAIERGLVGPTGLCTVGGPSCAAIWTDRLGMTVPTMSLVAAAAIAVGTAIAVRAATAETDGAAEKAPDGPA